ncbi:hypothetical protein NA57DRAFT_73014 [Rhizodiscina lignyota]|uniref:Uncharacterized protein n=1 Tax=Rhizodiscina lignyota TaxID=1504668 RepID=A0A9P4M8Z2_9PEZI|nr:hypothetical protein NA57DRAFT_73014 [Rhizodiscina lignyota]
MRSIVLYSLTSLLTFSAASADPGTPPEPEDASSSTIPVPDPGPELNFDRRDPKPETPWKKTTPQKRKEPVVNTANDDAIDSPHGTWRVARDELDQHPRAASSASIGKRGDTMLERRKRPVAKTVATSDGPRGGWRVARDEIDPYPRAADGPSVKKKRELPLEGHKRSNENIAEDDTIDNPKGSWRVARDQLDPHPRMADEVPTKKGRNTILERRKRPVAEAGDDARNGIVIGSRHVPRVAVRDDDLERRSEGGDGNFISHGAPHQHLSIKPAGSPTCKTSCSQE